MRTDLPAAAVICGKPAVPAVALTGAKNLCLVGTRLRQAPSAGGMTGINACQRDPVSP